MNTQLTPAMIERYREEGFLLVEDFLSPDELEHWRKVVMACVTGRGDTVILGLDQRKTKEAQGADDAYAKVFKQRVNLWYDNPAMRPLMINEQLGGMAGTLAGIDGIRIWHDQALIKEPWANATAFHKDNPYWSFHSPDAISVWIALDDVTLENGCLFFLPGTHKDGNYKNASIGVNMDGIFKAYPEYRGNRSVAVPMRAGSCSFHNGLTIHGANANMTPGYRRAMTCAYMPDGSTFNGRPNILTPRQVAALQPGVPLDDNRLNPLIWSRTPGPPGSRPTVTSDSQGNLTFEGKPLTISLDEPAYATPR